MSGLAAFELGVIALAYGGQPGHITLAQPVRGATGAGADS
jgi:hypothetical protein